MGHDSRSSSIERPVEGKTRHLIFLASTTSAMRRCRIFPMSSFYKFFKEIVEISYLRTPSQGVCLEAQRGSSLHFTFVTPFPLVLHTVGRVGLTSKYGPHFA